MENRKKETIQGRIGSFFFCAFLRLQMGNSAQDTRYCGRRLQQRAASEAAEILINRQPAAVPGNRERMIKGGILVFQYDDKY